MGKWDWLCSRFFLLTAFLCLFVNQAAEAPGLFSLLFSAGVQAGALWTIGTWIRMGGEKEKGWRREGIFVAAGFAGMLCVQFLLLTQASGSPEDQELWMKGWGGLPGLGEWIWEHWRTAEIAAAGCVDFSVLMAVWFVRKQVCGQAYRKGHVGAEIFRTFFLLFLLIGISPWILVPQPLLFVMPVITGLMLYVGKTLEKTDVKRVEVQDGSENRGQGKTQDISHGWDALNANKKIRVCLAGSAAVLLFLLCLLAAGLNGAGIKAVFEGKSLPGLLLYWFESLKSGLSDGTFDWLSAPKLTPFTMNGWALRLQNTIYPGADRYGWYAGLAQGAWVLLLCMEAAVPVKRAGKETVFFLAAMLLLPLWQPAGSCMAAAVFLPWLAVRTCRVGELRNTINSNGPYKPRKDLQTL